MTLAWIVLGAAALWALIRLGRQSDRTGKLQWRVSATIFAAICFGGAALAAMRGSWLIGSVLATAGLWLASGARQRESMPRPPAPEGLSAAEARRILGVGSGATPEDIQTAWRRLMTRAHPDAGGTEGLAERLNQARDRLLKG